MVAALIPLLLVLGATFVLAGIVAGSNEYQIKREYDVSHTWETRERLAALVGFAVLAYWPQWPRPYLALLAFLSACCLFGLRFDIRLNLRRDKGRYYVGEDAQTASTDKQVRRWKLSGQAYAWLKLAGVLAFGAGAVLLSGCASSRPEPVDSLALLTGATLSTTPALPADLTPAQVVQLPRSVQRQYRKNLRAQPRQVPLVQGRAAVAAGGNIMAPVQASYKPAAAVVQAQDSAQVQAVQSRRGPAVAAGRDATVPITTTKESWLRPLLPYVAGVVVLGLLYSLLPLGLTGSGWLLAVPRCGRSREPETD